MDKAYVARENVIERYVRGTLPANELADFEIFMIEHPDIAEQVEYARGLDDGMRRAREEFFVADTASHARTPAFWQKPQFATAATLLLVSFTFATTWLYQRGSTLSSEIERLRAPAGVSRNIWLEALRGGGEVLIERRAGEPVLLHTIVDGPVGGLYRVELFDEGGRSVWIETDVAASDEPAVSLFIRDLPDGRYRVTVTANDGEQLAADRAFRLSPIANREETL